MCIYVFLMCCVWCKSVLQEKSHWSLVKAVSRSLASAGQVNIYSPTSLKILQFSYLGLSKLLQNDVWIFALKKTHRFEPFEYLYLHIMSITGGQTNTTRHSFLYKYFWDRVPWFQFLTKLSESHAINDTDWPHVLAYERSKFLCARLLSCCRKRACGGRWKIWVETWLFSWSWRCALMLLVVEF